MYEVLCTRYYVRGTMYEVLCTFVYVVRAVRACNVCVGRRRPPSSPPGILYEVLVHSTYTYTRTRTCVRAYAAYRVREVHMYTMYYVHMYTYVSYCSSTVLCTYVPPCRSMVFRQQKKRNGCAPCRGQVYIYI